MLLSCARSGRFRWETDGFSKQGSDESGRSFRRVGMSCFSANTERCRAVVERVAECRGITANVQFMLAISSRPLPDLVEHFGVQSADVRLFHWFVEFMVRLLNAHLCATRMFNASYSLSSFMVLIFGISLFGFFRADRGVPTGVLVIEDEVHSNLPRFKRRCASFSIS
jgi:hypothetical protein